MSLGLSSSRRRQRRQRRLAALKWLLILAALLGAGALAYATGSELARLEVRDLNRQVAKLETRLSEAKDAQARLRAELAETREALESWQARYEAEVPEGQTAALLNLLRERLADGVSAERLRFVVAEAQERDSCTGGPETRRFLVRTPLAEGAADSVTFDDGRLTVTAAGASAQGSQGRPEAWFDPAKPLAVTITPVGGGGETVEGTLPLHHGLVVESQEHRFSFVQGARRGFVEVTWRRCDYP